MTGIGMEHHNSEKEVSSASERLTNKDTNNDDEVIADNDSSARPCWCRVTSQQIGFVVQMYITYGLMGWNVSVLGPSLTDLAMHTNSSLEQAANLITCLFSGYLSGGMLVAPLLSRLDTHLNLCISAFIAGTATSLYSWFPSIVPMGAFVVLSGTGAIASLVAVSTKCMVVMGKRSPVVLQGALFVLSLFAATTPWIIHPLLSSSNNLSASENATIENDATTFAMKTKIDEHILVQVTNDSRIQFAFLMIGSCTLLMSGIRLAQFVIQKRSPLQRQNSMPTIRGSDNIHVTIYTKVKYMVLFLVFKFLSVSLEVTWGWFSAGYATKYFAMSNKDATLIPFVFWCCMAGSRLANVIISMWLSPGTLSLLTSIGIVLTAVALVVAGEDNQTAILLCGGFTGLFVAPLSGLSISWLGSLIGPCTTASATSFCGSAIAGMATGPLIAWLCAEFGFRLYSYANLVLSGCLLFVTLLIHVIVSISLKNGICSHLAKFPKCKIYT